MTRRSLFPALAVGLGALVLWAPAAHAAPCDYWVANGGSNSNPGTNALPWATLSFAVTAVPDTGRTVCVKDGTYTQQVILNKRFNTMMTLRAENQYKAILQAPGTVLYSFGGRNMTIEGFEVRHSAQGGQYVVQIQMDDDNFPSVVRRAEYIILRNNIFHDSLNNDIIKVNNGAHFITIEGNVFYNQFGTDQHLDINSVQHVTIQDNIFFNDFAGSGRAGEIGTTAAFIVVKDSGGSADGFAGVLDVDIRRNVFLNWQGNNNNNFILLGDNDVFPPQSYYEATDVMIENNLLIGNSPTEMRAALGVKGCKDITFRHNTVVGNLPACAYAMRLNQESEDRVNDNILFYNNIWSDPTQTMGEGCGSTADDFSDGDPAQTTGEVLDDNLYWNGGAAIPAGDVLSPLVHDANRVVADPLLNTNQANIVLPRWNGTTFLSGNTTIAQEFVRLVNAYGLIPANSPAVGAANPARSPATDILGTPRTAPDHGAFEVPSVNITINDVSVNEGDSGTVAANFTVSLSAASAQTITVQYATANNTATASSDYTAVPLTTLTFTPGQITRTATVNVVGEIVDEDNETFFVNLSNPSAMGVITDAQGVGTIVDDDPKSNLSVTKTDGVTTAAAGQVLTFTMVVGNTGPNDAIGATVTDVAPAGLTGVTWTCVGAGGATCGAANGAGSIAETVNVMVDGTLTYTLTGTVSANPTTVRNTVTVGVAAGYVDPNTANNTAVDDDLILCVPDMKNIMPDGRSTKHSLAGSATAWYLVSLKPESSYSAEFSSDLAAGSFLTVDVFRGQDGCSGANANFQMTATSAIDPRSGALRRWSFTSTAPGTDTRYRVRVVNNSGSPTTYSFSVSETTMFSPSWSTGTTYNTNYSFQNTTQTTITGLLTLRNTAGAFVDSHPISVPPGQVTAVNTGPGSMDTPRSMTGTAQFTHNGPPGSISAASSTTNFTFTKPYVQEIKFVPVRELR